jgi:hypothetical protein
VKCRPSPLKVVVNVINKVSVLPIAYSLYMFLNGLEEAKIDSGKNTIIYLKRKHVCKIEF